jgi:hypothetical protein
MVESCGYHIAGEQMTVIPVELFCKMPAANPLMRMANWFLRVLTRLFPSLFGYQIMFIARSVRRADAVSAGG